MTNLSELFTALRCEECHHVFVEADAAEDPVYKCTNCETIFNRGETEKGNHKCPNCGKFGSKIAEFSCPSCEHGPHEEIRGRHCPVCGTINAASTNKCQECAASLEPLVVEYDPAPVEEEPMVDAPEMLRICHFPDEDTVSIEWLQQGGCDPVMVGEAMTEQGVRQEWDVRGLTGTNRASSLRKEYKMPNGHRVVFIEWDGLPKVDPRKTWLNESKYPYKRNRKGKR